MIASVRGTVIDMGAAHVVVECGGVGHLVTVTAKTAGTLTRGQEGFLLTTLVVREDAMTLYGFASAQEREMFDLLQSVSGLGPRLAMAVLQVLDPADVAGAVGAGDAKRLQQASGVGKRMAERMLVELKDKVAPFAAPPSASIDDGAAGGPRPGSGVRGPAADVDQVVGALTGLGFREQEAAAAVDAVLADDASLDTSAALRAALKELGG
ncbi:Holliday junction branch migration protein RuvA [uncultured Corynebacterium sp.]|uniref:Holliday junction branch migration protein RuvA n=1 Tax=uncultured Corynebacterium sp. TaxID=159447 RepID=UPI0025DC7A72|nr:Holliday junction branch migration protein RuvA [uncultured Corynebacterium sp.]